MASTADTVEKDGTIEITYSDSGADWDIVTDLPAYAISGLWATAITYHGKDTDIFIMNEDSNDGPSICHWVLGADTDDRVRLFKPAKQIFPYIKIATDYCEYATIGSVKITITLK